MHNRNLKDYVKRKPRTTSMIIDLVNHINVTFSIVQADSNSKMETHRKEKTSQSGTEEASKERNLS